MDGVDYNSWGWQTPRELALPGNGLPGGKYTCFQRADQHVHCLFVGEARYLRSRTAEAVPVRDVYIGHYGHRFSCNELEESGMVHAAEA